MSENKNIGTVSYKSSKKFGTGATFSKQPVIYKIDPNCGPCATCIPAPPREETCFAGCGSSNKIRIKA